MEDLLDFADELGPAKVLQVYEPSLGLKGVVVVDNVALGPSIGGLRMAPDVSIKECRRLARAMTFKNAAAGLPHGGGKSVLLGDPKMPAHQKEPLIRAMACALRDLREYIVGPDMGTDEGCMAWVHDEIGRAVGLPREIGGIPLDEIGATGWGIRQAAEVGARHLGFPLRGARLAVQGFGAVGQHAARFLEADGVRLVAVADSGGTIHDPSGLDVGALMKLKGTGKSVVDYPDGEKLDREAVIGIECEIWVPAARPDVIHEQNLQLLRTRLVLQGANIPITSGAEEILHSKGVLSVPDFIANAGGVICAAMEYRGASQTEAMASVQEKVGHNTELVLEACRARGIPPRQAALNLATDRVRRGMNRRRWSIF